MLDAPILRRSLAAAGADLAFMASSYVYDSMIFYSTGPVDQAAYQKVRFPEKKAKITSWMYLAGADPSQNRPPHAELALEGGPANT
jgi:hypothetical protein